jgi:hypothetical protein
LVCFLSACPPDRLSAQDLPAPRREAPAAFRFGKWAAAGLAAGFTALAIDRHNGADRAYEALVAYCRSTPCTLRPDGTYNDAGAEARYQDAVRLDRQARAWFIGGQAAIAGAVALFILEVRHGPREPSNIPYEGPPRGGGRWALLLEPGRVGVRVPL